MTGTAPETLDSGAVQLLGRRDRVVFAALALSRPAAVSQAQLAEALWPDGPPASAAKLVQGCVSRLRAQLGSDTITTLGTGYVLSRHAVTEADLFERGVDRGRDLLELGQADRAAFLLDERLRAWAGPPYDELDRWPPAEAENSRLVELKLRAEELLVDALLAAGDLDRAAVQARAFAEQEPLRESRWAQLALASYRLGQQAAALDALRSCRERLADELGIDPGAEVAALELAILRQDPALAGPTPAPVARADEECPWPGMSPYGPDEAESFFGRDDDVVAALGVLDARGALAVVGPSGIGKSSFVRAGVIPALRAGDWTVQLITPSAHALAHGEDSGIEDGVDVLVLDQAEELFGLPGAQRAALLAALEAHRGPRVIVMRADQMTEVAAHAGLARLVEKGLFLLGGLSTAGLTAAIEQPAAQRGLLVEPGLVDLLLRDLEGEPGALPLFSHALAQTWRHREGRTLTVAGYRATGGVSGAVARSAERVYAATDAGDRTALRSLMLRLVAPGSEGEPRRARVPADQLTDAEHLDLVDALVQARLVTRDADTLTLTHEALVDGWPRLREWLDEDVEGRRVFHHLAASARAWEELGRPDSELYRGVRLARAAAWAATEDLALSETESEFLAAGQRLADAEAAALVEQVRRQKRTNRVLRSLLAGLAVVLVGALVAGLFAVLQARRADRQALDAVAAAVGAKALKTDDPQLALLLAAAAEQVSPTPDTLRSLSSALAARPLLAHAVAVRGHDHVTGAAVGDDRVFSIDRVGVLRSFDADLHPMASRDVGDGHRGTIDPALVANDRVVVVGAVPGSDRQIRLLDPRTLEDLPRQLEAVPPNIYVVALALSADGRRLAVVFSPATSGHPTWVNAGNTLEVWDLPTGLPAGPRIELEGKWNATALSADGTTVFSSTPVAAYDVASGTPLWSDDVWTWNSTMDVHDDLVATDTQGFKGERPGVQIFDARTGRHRLTLPSTYGSIQQITFSRDGAKLGVTGTSGRGAIYDTESWEVMQSIDTGEPPIYGGAFSADGGTLYVVKPFRQELQAWNLDGTQRFLQKIGFSQIPLYKFGDVRLSNDGTRIATQGWTTNDASGPMLLTIFDVASKHLSKVPVLDGDWPGAGAWNASSDRYATANGDGWVQVVDADRGVEAGRAKLGDRGIVALSYAGPDRLVAGTEGRQVQMLNARTLAPVGEAVTLPEDVRQVAGLADGHTALVLGAGAETKVTWAKVGHTWYRVDLGSGRILQTGKLRMPQALTVALSPDESHAAFGGTDGLIEIVDLSTGRAIRAPVSDGSGDMASLAFDPNGDRLLSSAGVGRPLGLWDARTGTPLAGAGFVDVDEATQTAAFGPDGRVVVAALSGNVYLWDVSAKAAIDYACKVAGRELTRQEWRDAFGDVPYRRVCEASRPNG